MTAPAVDHNTAIIEEFRSNDGVVGGRLEDISLILVHHTGAKSGVERVTPLAAQVVDGGWAVFASKGGADENPAWYYNLLANPQVTVEFGAESFDVVAHEATGDEYDQIWTRQKADLPFFAGYEEKTARAYIPVIVLERV